MLQLKNVSKKFGEITAVDNINLEIKSGEIIGFLGPNGAGKTTTMRLITGFLTPNTGEIKVGNLAPKKAHHLIGYLPEENPLYSQYTPLEYLKFVGLMHGLSINELNEKLQIVIVNCGINEVLTQKIETLSRGYKQRVGLAATLIHDPKLIVMDEPTTGLDPNQQVEIRKLIKEIAKDKAIIFSTHILSEAQAICQRVIIINRGKIVGEQEIKKIKKNQTLEKIFTKLTNNA